MILRRRRRRPAEAHPVQHVDGLKYQTVCLFQYSGFLLLSISAAVCLGSSIVFRTFAGRPLGPLGSCSVSGEGHAVPVPAQLRQGDVREARGVLGCGRMGSTLMGPLPK